jgi:hypothetical protein
MKSTIAAKRVARYVVLGCSLLLALAGEARASISVFIYTPGEVSQGFGYLFTVVVQATAGETVNGANLALTIDGPPGLAPIITAVDLNSPGTIFGAAPSTEYAYGPPYDPPTQTLYETVQLDNPGNVSANGILAYVTFDAFQNGAYLVHLDVSDGLDTELWNSDNGVYEATLFNGAIYVGPEPGSDVLGLMALVGFIAYGCRRRRRHAA